MFNFPLLPRSRRVTCTVILTAYTRVISSSYHGPPRRFHSIPFFLAKTFSRHSRSPADFFHSLYLHDPISPFLPLSSILIYSATFPLSLTSPSFSNLFLSITIPVHHLSSPVVSVILFQLHQSPPLPVLSLPFLPSRFTSRYAHTTCAYL